MWLRALKLSNKHQMQVHSQILFECSRMHFCKWNASLSLMGQKTLIASQIINTVAFAEEYKNVKKPLISQVLEKISEQNINQELLDSHQQMKISPQAITEMTDAFFNKGLILNKKIYFSQDRFYGNVDKPINFWPTTFASRQVFKTFLSPLSRHAIVGTKGIGKSVSHTMFKEISEVANSYFLGKNPEAEKEFVKSRIKYSIPKVFYFSLSNDMSQIRVIASILEQCKQLDEESLKKVNQMVQMVQSGKKSLTDFCQKVQSIYQWKNFQTVIVIDQYNLLLNLKNRIQLKLGNQQELINLKNLVKNLQDIIESLLKLKRRKVALLMSPNAEVRFLYRRDRFDFNDHDRLQLIKLGYSQFTEEIRMELAQCFLYFLESYQLVKKEQMEVKTEEKSLKNKMIEQFIGKPFIPITANPLSVQQFFQNNLSKIKEIFLSKMTLGEKITTTIDLYYSKTKKNFKSIEKFLESGSQEQKYKKTQILYRIMTKAKENLKLNPKEIIAFIIERKQNTIISQIQPAYRADFAYPKLETLDQRQNNKARVVTYLNAEQICGYFKDKEDLINSKILNYSSSTQSIYQQLIKSYIIYGQQPINLIAHTLRKSFYLQNSVFSMGQKVFKINGIVKALHYTPASKIFRRQMPFQKQFQNLFKKLQKMEPNSQEQSFYVQFCKFAEEDRQMMDGINIDSKKESKDKDIVQEIKEGAYEDVRRNIDDYYQDTHQQESGHSQWFYYFCLATINKTKIQQDIEITTFDMGTNSVKSDEKIKEDMRRYYRRVSELKNASQKFPTVWNRWQVDLKKRLFREEIIQKVIVKTFVSFQHVSLRSDGYKQLHNFLEQSEFRGGIDIVKEVDINTISLKTNNESQSKNLWRGCKYIIDQISPSKKA